MTEVIIPRKFKDDYLMKNKHFSRIWPGVVLFGGLPDTKKTTILKELLKRYVRKATFISDDMIVESNDDTQPPLDHEVGIDVHEVIAVGKKHQDFYWFELTSLNCYTYCIASAILNDAALSGKVICLSKQPSLGLFQNRVLDGHFQNVYDELKKQKFLKPIDDPESSVKMANCPINVWKQYLPRGLMAMNFWDFGVKRGILHTASALSGYFSNSYTCLFLDLERDAENLLQSPSLTSERFDNHPDKNFIYKWRSRVQYFLRLALFAKSNPQLKLKKTTANINMDKSCFIVAVYERNDCFDVKEKLQKLREVLELIAEQMGLTTLVDFDILPFDLNSNDSYRALKQRLEDRITQESIEFPLSWLFIRNAYYQQDNVYVDKEIYYSLAKECKIDRDEFESFLATFTASGSLIYASHAGPLSKFIILKPLQFFKKISEIFYPQVHTDMTEFGVISETSATETFQNDTPFYLTALTSLQLAIKLKTTDIDLLSAGLDNHVPGPVYYIPALRCGSPVEGCQLDSLHILFSIDVAPKSMQVAFIHSVFEVFRNRQMNIKLIPCTEVNVLQFEVFDPAIDVMPWRFEHVYHGDATEIRFHTGNNTPPSDVCQQMCDAIIATCHDTVSRHTRQYGPIKYGFAVMCSKDQNPSQPCNVNNVRHYLPGEIDQMACNACQRAGLSSFLLNYWAKAVSKVILINFNAQTMLYIICIVKHPT